MDQGAIGWLAKTCAKNLWRVQPEYDFDDLMQEGYWIYYKLKARYETKNDKHLMSLFMRSINNHIIYLAEKRTKRSEILASDFSEEGDIVLILDSMHSQTDSLDELHLVLNAPNPLDRLLKILIFGEGYKRLKAQYRITLTHRETPNERLCKIVGLDPTNIDLFSMLRKYLQEYKS